MSNFTVTTLEQLLKDNSIDPSLYGKDKAKSLSSLLKELHEGEAQLELEPLTRVIRVLLVTLTRNGKVLTEVNQYFHTTPEREAWSRQRMSILAEKLMDGETPEDSLARALKEELGLDYKLSEVDFQHTIETRVSASYPGLPTKYITYKVTMDAPEEVPDNKFDFTEYFPDETPRLTTTWDWI
jgi:hypothetical protein